MDEDRSVDLRTPDEVSGEEAAAAATEQKVRRWTNLWQVPAIFISLVLIALALRVAISRMPQDDFDVVLTEVEQLLEAGHLDTAGEILRQVLGPHVERAELEDQARYHAAAADWTLMVQRADGVDSRQNNLAIDRNYERAVTLGLSLSAARLERWIDTLLSLGQVEDARERLRELEAMDVGDSGLHTRRVELFQRIIQAAMARSDFPRDVIESWLLEHRGDDRNSANDRLWAIARQAELRMEAGELQRAVDQLLIDMRRAEFAAEPGEQLNVAEIYTLLGRGMHLLGDDAQAMRYLDRALDLLGRDGRTTDPVSGLAQTLAGRIAMANNEVEVAFAHFDTVVREFVNPRDHLPALLGRAEAASILGAHEDALKDYRQVVRLLKEGRPTGEVTPRRVAASLIDRHDASLAIGRLELALEYAVVAEGLFSAASVPTDVLFRIATTSRQLAMNMLEEAGGVELADVVTRHEANIRYEQAATYYIRHARAVTGLPTTDDNWADSLWLAAECYDLAGLHEQAITHFEEYLAGRSVADPRRPEVNFRLAQCHHALMQFESAARFYEQVIQEHPRSVPATRSHVPLARCYLALGRRPEAEQQLRGVLSGMHAVQRDAMDYRDAMIELGTLLYNAERYTAAIEQLHQAAERYPDDPRNQAVLFRLADSYRGEAMRLAQHIEEPTAEPPAERRRLDELRREHLRTAMEMFERTCAVFDRQPMQALSDMELDLMRSAYLHRADCAFHLGEYERAIPLYEEAARRFSEHHSSMHALIQIVNCHAALGDEASAAAAHRRALVRLRQLRDDAFDAPDALMDRQAWERWLENAPVEPTRAASAASNSSG